MGKRLVIAGADFGAVMQIETQNYLTASGITNPLVIDPLNRFVIKLKQNGLWSKISHLYPILGTTDQQIKFNLKTAANPLTNAGGGTILNTINKGIYLNGVADNQGATVDVPLTESFINTFATTNGHTMYFTNENLNPTGTLVPGLGVPLSSNLHATSATPLFYLTGALGAAPQKKGLILRNLTSQLLPSFLSKGAFGAIKNGTTVEFFGNGVSLGTTTQIGTIGTTTGNIRIGDSKFPVNNHISFVSFGTAAMTASEMILYEQLVIELIFKVHGIVV